MAGRNCEYGIAHFGRHIVNNNANFRVTLSFASTRLLILFDTSQLGIILVEIPFFLFGGDVVGSRAKVYIVSCWQLSCYFANKQMVNK